MIFGFERQIQALFDDTFESQWKPNKIKNSNQKSTSNLSFSSEPNNWKQSKVNGT